MRRSAPLTAEIEYVPDPLFAEHMAAFEFHCAQLLSSVPSSPSVTENLMSVPPSPANAQTQIAVMEDEAVAAPPCVPSAPGLPALVRTPKKNTRRARTESHALTVHPKGVARVLD